METKSIVRGVRLSADKGRLVADLVRGKKVDQAINILNFTQKRAAGIIKKALESAIANAEHNDGADVDELKVKTIYVDKADNIRRFQARALLRAESEYVERLVDRQPANLVGDEPTLLGREPNAAQDGCGLHVLTPTSSRAPPGLRKVRLPVPASEPGHRAQ